MNKLTIIGGVTKDAELRTTQTGVPVCTFSVAVNNRFKKGEEEETTFFRVTAWRKLAENCGKYITKGMKVCVVGAVGLDTYQAKDGTNRASLAVTAEDVEFLSSKQQDKGEPPYVEDAPKPENVPQGYSPVDTGDELPF